MELRRRAVVKALTWRAIATATTMMLVYVFTGEITLAAGIGALDISIKLILYYGHERIWNRIRWGRTKRGKKRK